MTDIEKPLNFIQKVIEEDLASGKTKQVQTRFPPEPNGYLHIGHAKSICLNFGLAKKYGGQCNLRFDDTNPEKEDIEYVESIKNDVKWLGFEWAGEVKFSSSYFDQLYDWAVYLIKEGKAYVCDLTQEETREYRGNLTEAGKNSPFRERSVEESLDLFTRMRDGEFEDGARSLRVKIDMAHGNMQMRDPIIYRIKNMEHHQTGDKWHIYPSYDYAHGQGDAIEGVTHSVCTLEFAEHLPLYNWFIENLPVPTVPRQYEFSRLNVNYLVTSKRKLKQLVDENVVNGWDDPRMPTISGMRRRGYTAKSIRNFIQSTGVTRVDGVVDMSQLEFAVREDLNENSPRAMCILRPLKVTLWNVPEENSTEYLVAPNHPQREELGSRTLIFDREIYIDKEDFQEEGNKKFKRLVIGKRVRLRNAYVIEADEAIKDSNGEIIEVKARIIEGTLGNNPEDGIKPKGVIHWVSAVQNVDCEVRLYDRLFNDIAPDAGGKDYMQSLNPNSLEVLTGCKGEVSLQAPSTDIPYQFEREGYYFLDEDSDYDQDLENQKLVFNRTIGLRDTWDK
ncbi:MAG: glutaminyl-tRNA synthetase [Cocleimonas sp.]|jgi:glutaminyl-tRNA synthetase